MVVFGSLTISIVDSIHFRSALNTLDNRYVPPTSKTMTYTLTPNLKQDILKKMIGKLKDCESVNISIDVWSDPSMRSFIGVCFHSITNDWTCEKGLLACERITDSHTGDLILRHFKDIIKRYDLNNKLFKVISDVGSNMVKAFHASNLNSLDKISSNFCHFVNKLKTAKPLLPPVSKSTPLKRKADALPLEDDESDLSDNSISESDDSDEESDDDSILEEPFIVGNKKTAFDPQKLYQSIYHQICNSNFKIGRLSCVAHMLQLAVNNCISREKEKKETKNNRN
jgi:hypothetical protein